MSFSNPAAHGESAEAVALLEAIYHAVLYDVRTLHALWMVSQLTVRLLIMAERRALEMV